MQAARSSTQFVNPSSICPRVETNERVELLPIYAQSSIHYHRSSNPTYIKLITRTKPNPTQCSHQSHVLSSSSPEHPSSPNQAVQHLSNSARSPPVHPVQELQAAHSPTCPSRAHTATRCHRGDMRVNQDNKSCTLMKLAVLEPVYVPPLFLLGDS